MKNPLILSVLFGILAFGFVIYIGGCGQVNNPPAASPLPSATSTATPSASATSTPTPTASSTPALIVSSQVPSLDATGVAANATFEITFNNEIDPSVRSAFIISFESYVTFESGHTAGQAQFAGPATAEWSSDGKTYTVRGITGWSNLTGACGIKTVEGSAIANKIKDVNGNYLAGGTILWRYSLAVYAASGTVKFYSSAGNPMANAVVTIEGAGNRSTSADGTFSFTGLAPGNYTIEASMPGSVGWGTSSETIVISADTTKDLFLTPATWEVLNLGGNLSGQTLESATYGFSEKVYVGTRSGKIFRAVTSEPSVWTEQGPAPTSEAIVSLSSAEGVGIIAADRQTNVWMLANEGTTWTLLKTLTNEAIRSVNFWGNVTAEMVTESNKVIQAQNVIIPSITYVELTKTGGFASSVQSTFHKDLNDINSVFAFGSSALASSYEGTNSWSNYGNLGTVAAGEDLVASLYTKNDSYEIVSSSIGSLFLSADSGATWTAELKNVPYVLRHFSENKRFPGLTYNLVVGDNGLVMMHR